MKINRNVNVSDSFIKALKRTKKNVVYGVVDQLDEISVFIQLVSPFLFLNNNKLSVVWASVLSCIITIITRFLTALYRELQGRSAEDIPIPLKRFTRLTEAGFIEISQEDGAEITKYLYEVEEYLLKKGLVSYE